MSDKFIYFQQLLELQKYDVLKMFLDIEEWSKADLKKLNSILQKHAFTYQLWNTPEGEQVKQLISRIQKGNKKDPLDHPTEGGERGGSTPPLEQKAQQIIHPEILTSYQYKEEQKPQGSDILLKIVFNLAIYCFIIVLTTIAIESGYRNDLFNTSLFFLFALFCFFLYAIRKNIKAVKA
jgi:hypothetical protein